MEPLIYTDLEHHVLDILNNNPLGLDDAMLTKKLKNIREEDKARALNSLLEKSRIDVVQTHEGLVYKYIDEEDAQRLRDLLPEETAIYRLIEEAGNRGLWINDIKKKAGNLGPNANTIVKKLEKKGFIKSVKSIKAKNRKVWMIISIEPSQEVTGGVLADDVFDLGLMELFGQKGVDFIKSQGRADRKQVSVYIRSLSLSQMDFSDEDIYRILESQVYDGRIEALDDSDNIDYIPSEVITNILPNKSYKISNWYVPRMIYTEIPGAFGSLFSQGDEGRIINPKDCKYYSDWF